MQRELKLNEKQKKYAKARAEGKTMADAAIEAGYSAKCKRQNITADAWHRENNPYTGELIKAEIRRLQKQAEEKALLDRQARQAFLTEIALDKEEKTDNRLRAADMLNRMSGDYTDVVRTSVTGGVELTYAEKKKLLEEELGE